VNYRHAFHVGNHADVLKHAVLCFWLEALKRKPTPFAVLDTHAGRGLYDLESAEASRSPEWQGGIAKLWDWSDPPPLIAGYVDAVRAFNANGALRAYPGSPALVVRALREGDALAACELHPEEHAALKRALPHAQHVQLHARDAWEAMGALLPPSQKRGLVLIDPPYEQTDETDRAIAAISAAAARFAHGGYLWWRPLKHEAGLARADAELKARGLRNLLRADLWLDAPAGAGRLVGSSLLIANPPFGLEPALQNALPALAARLGGPHAGWRCGAP
jgi:23S rRNA (adenine2030-N6)-methyltransferase